MKVEYTRADLGQLVRGKYAAQRAAGSAVVLLEPDVAKVFATDRAVNNARRCLINAGRSQEPRARAAAKPPEGDAK